MEDERAIAAAVERGLQMEGFDVDVATDGADGLWRAREGNYAAIILDILMPEMNGYDVCRKLRKEGNITPILMLTAKSSEHDVASGLDTGADDFLSKPFSFMVLMARLRALLRRGREPHFEELASGRLRYNPTGRQCWFDGESVELTGREAAVLEVLMRAGGKVVPKQTLLCQVWGMDFDGDPNIVDVYVGYLRRKIDQPYGKRLLKTVRGVGFRLDGRHA
ncbi:MAG: response regulator transcription factor [Thiohalocapsa sp.]